MDYFQRVVAVALLVCQIQMDYFQPDVGPAALEDLMLVLLELLALLELQLLQ
jgi:hypothetical protein